MPNEIEGIVAGLRGAEDVNQAYAVVDRWNRESRTADLLELAAAIEKACDVTGAAKFPYEAVADHVEEVLALTAGPDHIDALFTLLARDRVRSMQRPRPPEMRVRAFASRLGHGQTKAALDATIARLGDKKENVEVLACWMHETVLRGTALDREPAIAAFHARLAAEKHPLGELPLTLLESESEAPTYMPMYGANAISKAVARLESGPTSTRTIPPPGEHDAPRTSRIEDPALEARLREAVGPWTTGSNGKAEAKVFRIEPAIASASPGRWLLRALSLECIEGAQALLHAERSGPDAVWGALFAAAANGGAYSSGLGGAYGRRAAWTSLAALVDAPATATAAEVDAVAPSSQFLVFGASGGGWWNDVAWDIGTLALRPGGASVAVLAATDAD
ncbi:MAG: hypothetical protein JWP87_5218 [Labilithrix sp.]|jgi:hypothetical protein|nr:hypothetical protein [Labilithrix sp.]